MRLNRILVLVAVALFAAHTAHADDSGLKVGGGSGSPPCLTFSLSADSSGEVSNASGGNGLCENASNADYTFVGFTVLDADVLPNPPGGLASLAVQLGPLLAPFAGIPVLQNADWTVSCSDNGTTTSCLATQSTDVANLWSALCAFEGGAASLCLEKLSQVTAAQIESLFPNSQPCSEAIFYVLFGVMPGCDVSFTTDISGDGEAPFAANTPFGLSLPEGGSSLLFLLVGLGGLFMLQRKRALRAV